MIPSAWVSVVLVLATYRLIRLIGWDELPPLLRFKAWMTGEHRARTGSGNAHMGLSDDGAEAIAWRRPTLAHFFGCAFCQGFWVGCAVYVAWLEEPKWTLYLLAPFALNAAAALTAKNLDP